jgi:hypothetical protein
MAMRRPAEEETPKGYLWKRSGRAIGPFSVTQMRKMVRSGELGRSQPVSDDGGTTWVAASELAELWESTDLVPATATAQPPNPPETTTSSGSTSQATVVLPPSGLVPAPEGGVAPPPSSPKRGGWGVGLAGFITGTAALTLGLIPLGIWFTRYEPGYSFVPLALPLLAASITGLVLSGIALGRRGGGFATAGLVVGICGGALGLATVIGWLVSHDPREDWIRRLTATSVADMELARKDFTTSLRRCQSRKPNDDAVAIREQMTKDLLLLAEAHKKLLIAAASTPRFRQHFDRLDSLRTAYVTFSETIKLQDNMTPQQAIDDIGRESTTLRELLDLLDLYQTGSLSLEAAQAKFRAY